MEYPDLIVDLHEGNKGQGNKLFAVFWVKIKAYMNESAVVHEQCHGDITYSTWLRQFQLEI